MGRELPDVQAGFRKGRGTRDQIAKSSGSSKKQESSRKTSTSALLTMPKPLAVWITRNWKILKEMGIPDHLIHLLRNLYAGLVKAMVFPVVMYGCESWVVKKAEH